MKRIGAIMLFAGAVLLSTHILAPAEPPAAAPEVIAADLAALAQTKPIVDDVNAQARRLRERLASRPAYPPPTRDPFRFGSSRRTTPPAPAAAAPVPAAAPAPSLPRLIAITADDVAGSLVRTAVLGTADDVQVVKAGDAFSGFSVRSIGVDAVELLDPVSGRTHTLSLQ